MLNKGFDRQRLPTADMSAAKLGPFKSTRTSKNSFGALGDIDELEHASMMAQPSFEGSADASIAARQWMVDGPDDEMS